MALEIPTTTRRARGRRLLTAALPALLLLMATEARGSVIYSYTGAYFTTVFADGTTTPPQPHSSTDRVSGFVEIAATLAGNLTFAELPSLSFSFSDGVSTITSATATDASFRFTTDASGEVVAWVARVDIAGGGALKRILAVKDQFAGVFDSGRDEWCAPGSLPIDCEIGALWYSTGGSVFDVPGMWRLQSTTSVPEPTSLVLLGAGLAGLITRRCRRG